MLIDVCILEVGGDETLLALLHLFISHIEVQWHWLGKVNNPIHPCVCDAMAKHMKTWVQAAKHGILSYSKERVDSGRKTHKLVACKDMVE